MTRDDYHDCLLSEVGREAYPALKERGFQVTWETDDSGIPAGDGAAVIYHEDLHDREYTNACEFTAFLAGVAVGMRRPR